VVVRAEQGRGYAAEAARSLVDVLQAAGWSVAAYIHPGHLASQRVAQAAGLSLTTGIRDGEMRWASPAAGPGARSGDTSTC
jgi:RimJ/RimL family protein N-acetyltransferase